MLGSLLDRLLDEASDGGEPGHVALDELVRLLLRDVEPVGHPVGRQAVDDPVVDHLRLGAHPGIDLLGLDPEHPARGGGVDVLAAAEDLLEHVLAGDVGEQPQLDLRVVGRHEQVAGLGDEAGADLAPERGADRDVLEVGVVRGQPPGGGGGLVEGRVQAALGVDEQRERVEVGLGELGQLPPALDLGDDLVLGADRLQDPRIGRVAGLAAPLARQAELAEQDLLELSR